MSGCLSASGLTFACHTNSLLTVTGTGYTCNASSTVVSLGPYRCLNVSVPRTTQIQCRVPPFAAVDVEKRFNVSVTCAGATSPPLVSAIQSLGFLDVLSVIGCANQSNVGTPLAPAYRSSGCVPEERVSITGSGFGSVADYTSVWVVSGSSDYACTDVAVVDNSTIRCSLGAAPSGQWLSVRVQVGLDAVLKSGVIQFQTAPILTSVLGCVPYNSTAASLCRTGMSLTMRGANLQGPVNASVGSYPCTGARLTGTTTVTCSIPPIRWQDEGRWLNATVTGPNGTATLAMAVQSFGNLSALSATGCAKQSTVNGTSITAGCVPGGNVTIIGTGFTPSGLSLYIQDTRYPCLKLVYVNNHTLVCVGVPLPSYTDVYVPVLLYAAPGNSFRVTSIPLLSFSVVPRVTSVSGCVMLGNAATQCHPQQTLTISGSNFTSNVVALLYGHHNYTLSVSAPNTPTKLTVLLPAEVQPDDEQRLMSLAVQAGDSISARLPNAVWMVNALTLTGIEGCANQTSPTVASLCVAGALMTVRGTGFTDTSALSVVGYPSQPCTSVTYSSMQCRLPSVGRLILPTPYAVWVVSGTAQSPLNDAVAVMYIPTPDISVVSSAIGCTQPPRNQAPRDCQPGALLTVVGSGFLSTTIVTLYPRDNLPYPCAAVTLPNPTTLTCKLPTLPSSMTNSWLALLINNSLPALEAPSIRKENVAYYAGPPAISSSSDTRLGLTIDELVIVVVVVALVVLLVLAVQVVWCMTRYGVRFGRLERACPRLMKAMKGPGGRDEEGGRGGIHLGLLQADELRFDPLQPQPSGGRRTPYTPFAYQLASAAPPPPPTAPPVQPAPLQPPFGYGTHHLPQSSFPSHLVPPGSDPRAYVQYPYNHMAPPAQL